MAMAELYIGLMSGTSTDGVDGVLVDFATPQPTVLAYAEAPFNVALRDTFLALNTSGADELHRAALAANELVRTYARVVSQLLRDAQILPAQVQAIGAHGQTVRHRPQLFDGCGYTLQLNNPALLAELTGITVVADFRSRDVAAGGQGAPLVPRFHQTLFARPDRSVALLNLGGIANLTVLPPLDPANLRLVQGFDCGPANALLDTWCQAHTGAPFDADGAWAAGGKVNAALLQRLLAEPYFALPAPKSTGRDLFNAAWLDARLAGLPPLTPQDVQTTLTELTAQSCSQAFAQTAPNCLDMLVCGGGARNGHLMCRLQALLPAVQVRSTQARGVDPQQVEACAFAWLARQTMTGKTGNLSQVTGARGERILGAVYPA